jgi:hypothetical protein
VFQRRCPELTPLLQAELQAGNSIAATGPAMGAPQAHQVLLALSFRAVGSPLAAEIERRVLDDPHWWKEELRCRLHDHVLACGFG